jgi:hypothetical protein
VRGRCEPAAKDTEWQGYPQREEPGGGPATRPLDLAECESFSVAFAFERGLDQPMNGQLFSIHSCIMGLWLIE